MVERIVEPASTNPMTIDWQNLLNKLTSTTGGLALIDYVQDGTNPPKIKVGSRFEINGSFFVITDEDEEVTGYAAIPAGSPAYVYAVPNSPNPGEASTCTFEYRVTPPALNVALGGMFDGTARCLGWIDEQSIMGFRIWNIDAVPTQNVKITAIWHCPTPPLP